MPKRNVIFYAVLIFSWALVVSIPMTASSGEVNLGEVTFTVIADSHICGPTLPYLNKFLEIFGEHPCPDRYTREDNFTKAASHTLGELVFHLGDHIEDCLCCFGDCKPGIMWPACLGAIPTPSNWGDLESISYYHKLVDNNFHTSLGQHEYFMVLGNHDIRSFMNYMVQNDAKNHWLMSSIKHNIGYLPPYAGLDVDGWSLLFLNSGEDCKTKEEADGICFNPTTQLAPLRADLAKGAPTVLFWHVNPKKDIEDCDTLTEEECFAKYPYLKVLDTYQSNIHAVFVGHSHAFDHYTWHNIDFYVCGSTGKPKEWDKDLWMNVKLGSDGSVNILNYSTITWAYPLFLPLPATIDINPETLNLRSKGKWITCYIELLEGYDVADIDVNTILLSGAVPCAMHPVKIVDYDKDGILELMVKFERNAVQELYEGDGEMEIIVTGELDGYIPFKGAEVVRFLE